MELAYNFFAMFFILLYLVSTSSLWIARFSPLYFFMDFIVDKKHYFFTTILWLCIQIFAFIFLLYLKQRNHFHKTPNSQEDLGELDLEFNLNTSNQSENYFNKDLPSPDRLLLRMNNLSFRYSPKKPFAVKNLNLLLERGEIVSLAGRNGSGKSTLVKIILGLLSPCSGELSRSPSCSVLGFVPQDNLLFEYLTVNQALSFFMQILCINNRAYINNLIDTLNLGEFLSTRVKELSKGNQRKVSILLALLRNPDILILDEPTNNLGIYFLET